MDVQAVHIVDAASGSSARVAPGQGFNCYSFAPVVDGTPTELLWTAEEFVRGQGRPSGSGIPLLFPFAGRIGHQRFRFHQREFQLKSDDRRGNAIHGFVLDRPWQIVEQTADRVVGRFQASTVDRRILEEWPADFCLSVSYAVAGASLKSQIVIENPGSGLLPCWFGTHPYFRVPLGPRGEAANCQVQVPASQRWELAQMLPTGKRVPAEGRFALAGGLPFSQTELDDVFTEVTSQAGQVTTSITDRASGRRMVMTFDSTFREVVVYNPPHREAICLEPYTAVPDAFTLAAQGHSTGLWTLEPGERRTLAIEIRLEAL